ncbi:uncharacterized protein TrAFT101_005384 [Trichoderma asperellum]|uniref:uncharacterized protein n=1 Tax=Trichoderma asperellum TaxID=101201 RepID=UPI0033213387|nr:hypothetical protein TrAFT101_005384 [Trichoderma asperellum]
MPINSMSSPGFLIAFFPPSPFPQPATLPLLPARRANLVQFAPELKACDDRTDKKHLQFFFRRLSFPTSNSA